MKLLQNLILVNAQQNKTGLIKTTLSMLKKMILFSSIIILTGCSQNRPEIDKKFHWDDDGMLVIDGKRTFIIGSYHLPKGDDPYGKIAKKGYNYVRANASQEALDAAKDNNLKTWLSTGCIRNEHREDDQNRIAELVNKYKTHPALLCWEIADEPAWTWNSAEPRIEADLMIETYQFIKQNDPEHLIYTNHAPTNLVSTMQKYNDATDVVACDIYPVIPHGITPTYALFPDGLQGDLLNPYISQVGEYVDKMLQVTNQNKPLFMVLQGFAWEMLKKEPERNSAMIQYPTFEESRFMAYNAIIHGAVGINYWGTHYTPEPSPFMEALDNLTQELAEMQNILSARSFELDIKKEYHEIGYSVDTGVEILAKKVNNKTYLLTVNSHRKPVRVSLAGLKEYNNAIVLKEGRSLSINEGILLDDYKPFDVHVYELQ